MTDAPLHGGDVYQVAAALGVPVQDITDFSSNCNVAARELTARLVRETPVPFEHYPDPEARALVRAIARHEGASALQCMAGNGSSELIHLLVTALRPDRAMVVTPAYAEYSRALAAEDIPWEPLELSPEAGFTLDGDACEGVKAFCAGSGERMIVLCTPCNPTGAFVDPRPVLRGLRPGQTLVLDTAYRPFLWGSPEFQVLDYEHLCREVPPGARLLVLASPTKIFHCPGVRLGWLLSDAGTLGRLAARRAPWMVSGLAQELGVKLLEHVEQVRDTLRDLPARRQELAEALASLPQVERVFASCVNFLLLRLGRGHGPAQVRSELLGQGLLVRDCSTIPGLEQAGCIRVQVLDREANRRLVQGVSKL